MKDTQQQLLYQKSAELFKKYGVKNFTMDDLAKELGMSKKTIYRYVEDKADLVKKAMEFYLAADRIHLEAILEKAENPVGQLIDMMAYFVNQVTEFEPAVFLDIQKHYTEAWEVYNDYRYKYILSIIADNLRHGANEGYYRDDFDPDIISRIYIAAVDVLIDQRLFPFAEYVFLETYKEFLKYHLRGIVSQKGQEYMEQHNLFRNEASVKAN